MEHQTLFNEIVEFAVKECIENLEKGLPTKIVQNIMIATITQDFAMSIKTEELEKILREANRALTKIEPGQATGNSKLLHYKCPECKAIWNQYDLAHSEGNCLTELHLCGWEDELELYSITRILNERL